MLQLFFCLVWSVRSWIDPGKGTRKRSQRTPMKMRRIQQRDERSEVKFWNQNFRLTLSPARALPFLVFLIPGMKWGKCGTSIMTLGNWIYFSLIWKCVWTEGSYRANICIIIINKSRRSFNIMSYYNHQWQLMFSLFLIICSVYWLLSFPDYKRTSLAKYVKHLDQFLDGMARSWRGDLLRKSGTFYS